MALDRHDYEAAVQTHLGHLIGDEPGAGTVPGITFGVMSQGDLVYSGGLGVTSLSVQSLSTAANGRPGMTPTIDTAFRIASMTKSFTAASIVSLRDDGLLDFDARVASFIPEFDRPGWNRDVTIRHLLTMSAGFPTDDPWGDRQQALDPTRFRALIADRLAPAWRPGECFEYSNLGYAMLGLVIEAATGMEYRQVVRERVLDRFDLTATGFDLTEIGDLPVAQGYARRGEAWVPEAIDGCGAFAPMGGLLSNVADLARWVSALTTTSDQSLLEMQTGQRFIDALTPNADPSADVNVRSPEVRHYGYGLFEELLPYGRSVFHSGGYPGYGSHMRWHPTSGLGVVALGNRTYAPMGKYASRLLADLVVAAGATDTATAPAFWRRGVLAEAVGVADRLTEQWDEKLVAAWFADNMAQDAPLEFRRESLARLRSEYGPLARAPEISPRSPSPAEATWWLAGRDGARVRVNLLLSPHPEPKIQMLNWKLVDQDGQADTETSGDSAWPPPEFARAQINPRNVRTNF